MNAIHGARAADTNQLATLDTPAPNVRAPPPPPKPAANTYAPPPPPSGGAAHATPPPPNPTGCARETTQPDPNYVDPKAKQFANDAALVESSMGDAFGGGTSDGQLWDKDIRNAAYGRGVPQNVKEAALRLLAQSDLLRQLGNNGIIMMPSIDAYVRAENAKGPKTGTSSDPATGGTGAIGTPPPTTGETPGTDTTPGSDGTPGTGETAPPESDFVGGINPDIELPDVSTNPGIEGSCENLGAAQDSIQSKIKQFMEKMVSDPENKDYYSAQISNLTSQSQSLANLQNQLMQMMQNISKMFSDISMNAIRNIR